MLKRSFPTWDCLRSRALEVYAKPHRDLPARVRFYVGGEEWPSPRRPKEEDMVGQLERYAACLGSRRWPSLDLKTEVLKDEGHATVFPRLVTRGLLWALPERVPGPVREGCRDPSSALPPTAGAWPRISAMVASGTLPILSLGGVLILLRSRSFCTISQLFGISRWDCWKTSSGPLERWATPSVVAWAAASAGMNCSGERS